jgi:FAD dependent oxidoreductase
MFQQTVTSDITVVGGGLAGTCAAIAAARLGKSIALITNRPVLGGNSSSEVRVWVCGATAHGMQRFARETGIMGELYVENQFRNPEGNPIHWDEVVLDAVRAEPNIRLFLNTDVRTVEADDIDGERVVRSVTGWTMGSEITSEFRSPYVIDATGDGLVGYLAGAEYRLGREARSEFDEAWAPDRADTEFLGSTILFYTKDVGRPVVFVPPDSTKDIRSTPIPESRIIRSGDNGAQYWWIEWGGDLDIVHDNERIRDELKSVVFGIWDYIKNSGSFDAANLDLEWVGALPGKREYRRFIGDYTLTQNDILEQTEFDDAVGFGGWSIDLHPSGGMYAQRPGALQRYSDGVYAIPFRSYYSANVANLLVAGRDVSATHVAFGSSRVMATCAVGGEAAGTGAALALELGVRPRELAAQHSFALQQTLLRQDASLMGVSNDDPADLARLATVTASSTRSSVDSNPGEMPMPSRPFALDADLGIVVPVDPRLDAVSLLLRASEATVLRVSLWSTSRKQNYVPSNEILCREVSLSRSSAPEWVTVPLQWMPTEGQNAVVVVEANEHVSLVLSNAVSPGVLALVHRAEADGDVNVEVAEDDALVAWPAHVLRGWGVRMEISPPTEAYSPSKAVGGYHRPFGGPQLWVSNPVGAGGSWLALEWSDVQEIQVVRLVFDDNVDIELNTLHHHRTPNRIFPELVKDYVIEGRCGGSWQPILAVNDNRRRHRIHDFGRPIRVDALRISVEQTNGDPCARIVSVRAYSSSAPFGAEVC